MFVLRAFRLDSSPVPCERWQFAHLPIRIGRNPLNDYCPQHTMVSGFHARIENIDGKLCIHDLGSRNGVFIATAAGGTPQRIEANSSVDLAPAGFCFFLSWHVRVQLEFVQEEAPLRVRGAATTGSVLGNVAMIAQPGPQSPASAPPGPAEPMGQAGPNAMAQASDRPPAAPGASGYPAPGASGYPAPGASGYPAAPPKQPAPAGLPPLPGAVQAGAVPSVQGQLSGDQPPATLSFKMELDSLALQGLREVAQSLVPGRPLETTGDVARLVTKLHDTVDVFCRCFIPLRQGYEQFTSSLDLQRSAAQRSYQRSRSALALEGATSPEAVAAALLDPRDRSFDAPEAVEGILADLMLHQVALLDGVMEGVRALLDELSPQSIEGELAARGTAGLFGAKYRARWGEFCERFERLSDERQAFAVIFGQSFAEVYRQYWHRKSAEDQRLRTDPPQG